MPHILVTRPAEDFKRTSNRLAEYGFSALHAPMMRFELLKFNRPEFEQLSALIFTSANGIRAILKSDYIEAFKQLGCYVVGEQTSALAKQHGFKIIAMGNGDVLGLCKAIVEGEKGFKKSRQLLHISGHHQAGNLKNLLAENSIDMERLQAYNMVEITELNEDIQQAFIKRRIKAMMFYSSRSARIFIKNIKSAGLLQLISEIPTYCLSNGIALNVCKPYLKHIYFVEQPNEDALLKLMHETIKN